MPILSNGLVVGISSDRARYHASRLKLSVSRDTPQEALFPLVDIVYADANQTRNNWSHNYIFTGRTLADKNWLSTLGQADQLSFMNWLNESHVRYEIEGARRKLIYDEIPASIESYDYPARLSSHLCKLVHSLPEMKLSPGQWRQTLLNMKHKGIRQEELYWSGILSYLKQAEEKSSTPINKQELLANIDFSPIRIEMTNELVYAGDQIDRLVYRGKYRYISLHGGEDYREWLISLPDYQRTHFCSHFTERNVLLHLRTKTRFDQQGRKLLFIEEIQSDWHQAKLKKRRFRLTTQIAPAPFRKEWIGLGLKLMLMHAVKEGFDGLSWADGEVQAARYNADIPFIRRVYDKAISKQLMALSRYWHGQIGSTTLKTKPVWFQIKKIKGGCKPERRHEAIRHEGSDNNVITSILAQNLSSEIRRCPMFIMPEGMVNHIRAEGLPLFGEHILPQK